jgi:uncharacterized membrane protein YvbJ
MAYCKNCGNRLEDGSKFCSSCGTRVSEAAQEEQTQQETPVSEPIQEESLGFDSTPKASGNLNVGSLVWSIINLALCCMPLGIASLIMTVLAKDAPSAEDEEKKLKIARICNLIATISCVVFFIFYILIVVVGAITGYATALSTLL